MIISELKEIRYKKQEFTRLFKMEVDLYEDNKRNGNGIE